MSILIAKNDYNIAFFDSGIGGLTVYSEFRKLMPNENCIYFGDLKHLPYGNKTKEELLSYSKNIFNFFMKKNVKAVIMACNTSSAATYSVLKDDYDFKIYPIIQESAKIIGKMNVKKIGVFATESTIKSNAYEKELHKVNPNLEVFSKACPQWVNIVEAASQNDESSLNIIKNDLFEMLKNKPDKIILGCTHYPYLLDVLSKYADKDIFIDPAKYFVQEINKDLIKNNLLSNSTVVGRDEFFVSAEPEKFKIHSKMFYEAKNVKLADE